MPTSVQIRVARTLLRWSARELAEHASLDISTIKRMEHWETMPGVRDDTVQKAQAALEAAGIKFTKRARGDPGVRFQGITTYDHDSRVRATGKGPTSEIA